jgi:ATP-dependent Lon protease
MIPLDDMVVFPGMDLTLPVDLEGELQVVLVPRHGTQYAKVGVVANVVDRVRMPGGPKVAGLTALQRAVVGAAEASPDNALRVNVEEHVDATPPPAQTRELEQEYRAIVHEILDLRGDDGRLAAFLRSITSPGALADTSGYSPDLSFAQKVELLEQLDVVERLRLALGFQRDRLTELQVRKRIREDVESGAQKQQREFFLRRQMDSIRKELGEDDSSGAEDYRTKITAAGMPDAVREQAERELGRLEKMGDSAAESSMIRSYLDWLIAVPWSGKSEDNLDPKSARGVLDADHAGLDDVKRRITEHLAVRKLRTERGVPDDRSSGVILLLAGPPGTGKTSIGESIARAMGRKFVRMSLGGVRDEADIRGHRRTYIGALPGRLVRALRDAGTMNPVILLDEVDKIGADWRGDPASALLEVLDPAQNHSFRDHYLDVELDLSKVFFIATANVLDTIPPALLDRMETIRFDGYTVEEKLAIARGYLWPRQAERNALREGEATIEDPTLRAIVTDYTREAGVRQLEREIGTLLRRAATRIASGDEPGTAKIDEPFVREALGQARFHQEAAARELPAGVATGLAVTGTGGEVLFVEAATMGGSGQLVLTGQLGDVMKESARIALTYVRSRAHELNIDHRSFVDRDVHLHVPAGAMPKDGPSAGVTMVTALASLLTRRAVRRTLGMTGEVTLRGRVLPIGGLKQKLLAADAAGLTDVVIPEANLPDLKDVPKDVLGRVRIHPVSSIDEVLALALEPETIALAA